VSLFKELGIFLTSNEFACLHLTRFQWIMLMMSRARVVGRSYVSRELNCKKAADSGGKDGRSSEHIENGRDKK